MLDLHNHILPEVDDGARSLDEALAIARGLNACGFTTLAPSPHHGGSRGGDVDALEAQRARERLHAALAREGLELELLPNSEHCISPVLFERIDDARKITTIGGRGPWLLVELPWLGLPRLGDQLFRLQTKGYRLLLAHPERYMFLDPEVVVQLTHRDIKLQLEIGSFVGVYGKRAQRRARILLPHAHILASDVHRPEQCPWVSEALGYLRAEYGDRLIERACVGNAWRLVDGEDAIRIESLDL